MDDGLINSHEDIKSFVTVSHLIAGQNTLNSACSLKAPPPLFGNQGLLWYQSVISEIYHLIELFHQHVYTITSIAFGNKSKRDSITHPNECIKVRCYPLAPSFPFQQSRRGFGPELKHCPDVLLFLKKICKQFINEKSSERLQEEFEDSLRVHEPQNALLSFSHDLAKHPQFRI